MDDAEYIPPDKSIAEVLAEAYDEPVEQFEADTGDMPDLDDLESVPEEERRPCNSIGE